MFTLIVLIAFLVIVFMLVPRVPRVCSGHRVVQIAGATLFIADVSVALMAVFGASQWRQLLGTVLYVTDRMKNRKVGSLELL